MSPRNAWDAGGAEEGEMGIDQSRGLDATTSERMLAGEDVGPENLVRLLAAAAAPPRDHEAVGEDAAVTAFRAARQAPVREGISTPVVARRATLLGLKTVVAVAAAVAAAGAALAAGTGVLPNPFEDVGPPFTTAVSSSVPAPGTSSSRTQSSSGSTSSSAAPTHGRPTPPASMVGLCHAYRAQEDTSPGKAAANPAFAALVAAAGGVANVPGYCATVLGEPLESPAPPQHPTGSPGNRPIQAPDSGGNGNSGGSPGSAGASGRTGHP